MVCDLIPEKWIEETGENSACKGTGHGNGRVYSRPIRVLVVFGEIGTWKDCQRT